MITPIFKLDSRERWRPQPVETAERFATIGGRPGRSRGAAAAGRADGLPAQSPGPDRHAGRRLLTGSSRRRTCTGTSTGSGTSTTRGRWPESGGTRGTGSSCRSPASTAAGEQPVLMTASQHRGGEKREFWRCELDGGRPVIYVALGSHANFFTPGERGEDQANGAAAGWPTSSGASSASGRRGRGCGATRRARAAPAESPGRQGDRWARPHVFHAAARCRRRRARLKAAAARPRGRRRSAGPTRALEVLDAGRAAGAGARADLARRHQRVMVAPARGALVVVEQQLGDVVPGGPQRVAGVVAVERRQRRQPLVAFVRQLEPGAERLVQRRAGGRVAAAGPRLALAREPFDRAELARLEAGRRRERVAELEEALGPHRLEHLELLEQQPLDRHDATQPRRGDVRAAVGQLVARRDQLVQHQLEPELVGLVDDDEQQLVVCARRERLLQPQQVVDQQVRRVVGPARGDGLGQRPLRVRPRRRRARG